jgi:hypothetical protein
LRNVWKADLLIRWRFSAEAHQRNCFGNVRCKLMNPSRCDTSARSMARICSGTEIAQISHSGADVRPTAPNLPMLSNVGLLIWPSLTAVLLHGRKRRRYMAAAVVADVAQR